MLNVLRRLFLANLKFKERRERSNKHGCYNDGGRFSCVNRVKQGKRLALFVRCPALAGHFIFWQSVRQLLRKCWFARRGK